jgi:hypothetical protein
MQVAEAVTCIVSDAVGWPRPDPGLRLTRADSRRTADGRFYPRPPIWPRTATSRAGRRKKRCLGVDSTRHGNALRRLGSEPAGCHQSCARHPTARARWRRPLNRPWRRRRRHRGATNGFALRGSDRGRATGQRHRRRPHPEPLLDGDDRDRAIAPRGRRAPQRLLSAALDPYRDPRTRCCDPHHPLAPRRRPRSGLTLALRCRALRDRLPDTKAKKGVWISLYVHPCPKSDDGGRRSGRDLDFLPAEFGTDQDSDRPHPSPLSADKESSRLSFT